MNAQKIEVGKRALGERARDYVDNRPEKGHCIECLIDFAQSEIARDRAELAEQVEALKLVPGTARSTRNSCLDEVLDLLKGKGAK